MQPQELLPSGWRDRLAPAWRRRHRLYASWGFRQKALDINQQQANTARVSRPIDMLQKANAIWANPSIDTSPYDKSIGMIVGKAG